MKKLILFGFILFGLYFLYTSIDLKAIFSKDKNIDFKDYRVSVTYSLNKNNSLSYNIPKNAFFKFIISANLDKKTLSYDKDYRFALKYTILDNDSQIIKEKIYNFKTKVAKFKKDGEEIIPSFYLKKELIPSLGRKIFIDTKEFKNARKLIFKLYSKENDIFDISLRSYIQETNKETKLNYLWERLKKSSKESLAKANIYTYDLMTKDEKRNSLREIFRPFGPLGVKEKDYFIRKLYVLNDDFEGVNDFIPGDILKKGEYKYYFIKEDSNINFEIFSFNENSENLRVLHIDSNEEFIINKNQKIKIKKGYIKVTALNDVLIKLLVDNDAINSYDILKRSYLLDKEIEYEVNHFNKNKTPLRVDLHIIDKNSSFINYSLYDKNYKPLKTNTIKIDSQINNRYKNLDFNITKEQKLFFRLDKNIKYIKLSSEAKHLISVYNRPYNFKKKFIIKNKEINSSTSWFNIKPLNEKEEIFFKIDPEFLEKEESIFLPVDIGNRGEFLFVDYNSSDKNSFEEYDKRVLSTIYSKLETNKKYRLHFDYIIDSFSPKLTFFKDNKYSSKIEIYKDNKLYFKQSLFGKNANISLPKLQKGYYDFIIKTKDKSLEVYLSHITNDGLKKQQRKLFSKVKEESFYINKQNNVENIILKVFQKTKVKPLKISLEVKSKNFKKEPYEGFTFRKREYILYANSESKTRIYNKKEILDGGNLLFLTLDKDLKNTIYKITLQSDESFFVSISKKNEDISRVKVINEKVGK